MLFLDKESFFNRRNLPEKSFFYFYNGEKYEITSDYVIKDINVSQEGKCLFILNELNASDDFVINVYLQNLADECMQRNIRNSIYHKISDILLYKRESYKFKLGEIEYIAYQDDEGRYHIDELKDVGIFAGNSRYSAFEGKLRSLLNSHVFDLTRVKK